MGGVIVGAFFSALVSIMKYIADPYSQLPSITFWFMGSFASINYTLLYAAIPMGIGITLILLSRWKLNVLNGQAVRELKAQLSKGQHILTIRALDSHIIIDQCNVVNL